MRALQWVWARRATCLKTVGLVFLISYFWFHPFDIEWNWVAAYVAIALSVGVAFGLIANPILERLAPSQRFDVTPYGMNRLAQAEQGPLREAVLLPGEDGFFFVPLFLIGITPLSAAIAAAAYAAAHYPAFPAKHSAVKFAFLFPIALFVLPYGLASVVVGHLIIDALAFWVGRRAFARESDV